MCQVLVDIPNEVLYDTHMSTADAAAFVKQMVALGYYTHNNVSIGYCAKIAGMTEEEFMTHIITEICDYAVENDMEPDDTLSTIADNIKLLLEISTFNGWKGR